MMEKIKTSDVDITFYTDPLCCWTWAMWPTWMEFVRSSGGSLVVHYKMAGLLPSWKHYHDAENAISKPIQMGPEWAHAKAVTGARIDNRIWVSDPPASSYPSCIAVRAVGLQSAVWAETYFHMIQEAVMTRGVNIAKTAFLIEAALSLAQQHASFDVFRFREDLLGAAGRDAFSKDLQETRYRGIQRLPTLLVKPPSLTPFLLQGFQTRETLSKAFAPLIGSGSFSPLTGTESFLPLTGTGFSLQAGTGTDQVSVRSLSC